MRGEGRQRWEGEHRREKGRRKEIRFGLTKTREHHPLRTHVVFHKKHLCL